MKIFNSKHLQKVEKKLPHLTEIAKYTLEEIRNFDLFKVRFNKTYPSKTKEKSALLNFLINQKEINEHNIKYKTGLTTFLRALWQYSDLPKTEINLYLNGFIRPVQAKSVKNSYEDYEDDYIEKLPKSVNWVNQGYVTPGNLIFLKCFMTSLHLCTVLNQGLCGSCWSFSGKLLNSSLCCIAF